MKRIIINIVLILCVSCVSFKEKRTVTFFNQWKKDTEEFLLKNKPKTKLEKNINEILNISECSIDYDKQYSEKVEYKIYPKFIRVSMYNHLPKDFFENYFFAKEIFVDSLFKNTINCTNLKTLILTEEYKDKLPKKRLRYGFGSSHTGKNIKNAKVILERHHNGSYYKLSGIPTLIDINQAQDTVIVHTSYIYKGIGKRYVKVNNVWKYDKKIYELTE